MKKKIMLLSSIATTVLATATAVSGIIFSNKLMYIKQNKNLSLLNLEDINVSNIKIRRKINSITITANMEDLLELSLNQNFVPVVDDLNHFIGIITRRDIIKHFYVKNGF